MLLGENIRLPQTLQDSIDQEALTIPDYLLLSVADMVARLFPLLKVWVGIQPQDDSSPAVFVGYHSISNQKRLTDSSEYRFGLDITYVPADHQNRHELHDAIFRIQQGVEVLQSPIGSFGCHWKESSITDGVARVTGVVGVWEQTVPDGEIITEADQTVLEKE